MTTGTDAARAASRRDDLRRRLRGTSGRGRKLRGLVVLLAPYKTRVTLMFLALVVGGWPDRLALVAVSGRPNRATSACAVG